MQHALVRKDAVMLHDPLRTQSRATAVGVIVAAIGMLGFMIFGILKPSAPPPNQGIVLAQPSGTLYVKLDSSEKYPNGLLIPATNLASARLILMGHQQAGGQQGAAAAQGQSGEAAQPQVVKDERLLDIPKGRKQGIMNGPLFLPNEDQRISENWAVCDNLVMNYALPDEASKLAQAKHQTAVLAGVSDLGTPLGKNEAILAKGPANSDTFLIYRPKETVNRSANMVKAKVNTSNPAVVDALGLSGMEPRPASLALLNAIESVGSLDPPVVPRLGQPATKSVPGVAERIGDVFQVSYAGDETRYFVLLEQGKQQVTAAVANLIRSANQAAGEFVEAQPAAANNVDTVDSGEPGYLDVDNFPVNAPEVIKPTTRPSFCLGWNTIGEGNDRDERTTVYVDFGMPLPKDKNGNTVDMMDMASPGDSGMALTGFYMPPGRGAFVNAATGRDSFKSGPLKLISDEGKVYGIKDLVTAKALGLVNPSPAPQSIVGLLPSMASLNVQEAMRAYDKVELKDGSGDYNGQDGAAAQQQGQSQQAPAGG